MVGQWASDPDLIAVDEFESQLAEGWTRKKKWRVPNAAEAQGSSKVIVVEDTSFWDILTSERVAYLEIPDLVVRPGALSLEVKGKAVIGVSIGHWKERGKPIVPRAWCLCRFCKTCVEDAPHAMFICNHPDLMTIREVFLQKLYADLPGLKGVPTTPWGFSGTSYHVAKLHRSSGSWPTMSRKYSMKPPCFVSMRLWVLFHDSGLLHLCVGGLWGFIPGKRELFLHTSISNWWSGPTEFYPEVLPFAASQPTNCQRLAFSNPWNRLNLSFSQHAGNGLVAIYIDYRDRAHISISHVISPPMNDINYIWDAGFSLPVVFCLCTTSDIASWALDAHAGIQTIPQDVHHPVGTIGLTYQAFKGSLYVFNKGSRDADATVYSLPLPSTSNQPATHSGTDIIELDIPYSFASNHRQLWAEEGSPQMVYNGSHQHMTSPDYGVLAVTYRRVKWEGRWVSVIHFGPAHAVYDKLRFGQKDGDTNPTSYLGLHFSAIPFPHITFRKLDIEDLVLTYYAQIALDDTLGQVFVVDGGGRMTVISYA
ncbi:hypothetical protein C8R44DRAFT_861423 [Mycena epipterygia]|nr:hypothetical protein C8R44DRAFT_861423 [Mycena epipterygia]